MAQDQSGWSEADSRQYRELAAVAVPSRDEQMATLVTLLPFGRDDGFHVVELGCGDGTLASAILRAYPRATVLGLDGSNVMRQHAAARLASFGGRTRVQAFDLASSDWLTHLDGADCVVSSLAVHHLDGEGKRGLFAEVCARMSPHGALLIADLVEPQRHEARALFADAWERSWAEQSRARTGGDRLYRTLVEDRWNVYRFPDPVDTPSPLYHQLRWLEEAGFAVVDCFWMRAGHAIYGGYKARGGNLTPLPLADAAAAVCAALQA